METKKFQQKCVELVNELDKKFNIKRDPHLSFVQLIEEVGELAKDINLPRLRNKEADRKNLEGEFADVIMQLAILARMYKIDFEDVVEDKINNLRERYL